MRVRVTQDCTAWVEGQYRLESFKKGQEFDGALAQYLADTGSPVEVIDEPGPVDPGAVPEGTAKEVLDWVGDDKERAAMALDIEQAKGDNARSTLMASLTKLAG